MAGGRPTKYKPEMCQVVIDMMKEGASKTEVAAELDIVWDTLARWQVEIAEFSEAIKKGEKLSEAWWLRKGRVNLENKDFSPTLWYMNMKNRHGWSDKQETVHSGTIGLKDLSDAQLDARLNSIAESDTEN